MDSDGDLVFGSRLDQDLQKWRLLDLSFGDPYLNMAVEEAVLRAVGAGEAPPTLRLWQNEDAVVIGYSQRIAEEVDLEACRRRGTAVVRRISGGGTVYQDRGNLNYSLFAPLSDWRVSADVRESFEFLCRGFLKGLEILGLQGEFRPINDITVGGCKLSGTAQARRWGAVLHHGTLMIDVDIGVMEEVLRIHPDYLASKGAACVADWVTTMAQLGKDCGPAEVKAALVAGFEYALEVRFVPGILTEKEEQESERLSREQYCRPEWNALR